MENSASSKNLYSALLNRSKTSSTLENAHEKLLSLIFQQTVRAALPTCVVIVMITILLYRAQPMPSVLVWTFIATLHTVVHILVFGFIQNNQRLSVEKKTLYICALTCLNGVVLSSCLVFFNALPIADRTILTIIFLALAAGSIGAFAGYKPMYLCFVAPIILPLTLLWLAYITSEIDPMISTWIASLLLVITGLLAAIGQDTFDFFSTSITSNQEKNKLNEELIAALEQQEISKRNAERSNQSKTRLLASVSHDLRQPVHVLNLFGTALKHANLEDDAKKIVEDMNKAIFDLSSQINVLLDITKFDGISYEPTIRKLCVTDVMKMIAHTHRVEITNRGLSLNIEWEENLCVKSDQQLLAQIIRNLVGNAIKYTPDGHITLRAHSDGEEVLLSIIDTGIGINQSELNSIFEEYYQIDNPERNLQKGLGLGLFIVKRAVDILNHSIEAKSVPGVGSTFTIRMKRSHGTVDSLVPTTEPIANLSSNPTNLRVHVIDDDVMVCKSMRSALEALGCEVSTTQSTEATSEYFSNHNSPDLFIIDIRLQGDDSGFITHRYVSKFHPNSKSVFMSGELGALHRPEYNHDIPMIRKPVNEEQLAKLLSDVAAKAPGLAHNSSEGGMNVDSANRSVAGREKAASVAKRTAKVAASTTTEDSEKCPS